MEIILVAIVGFITGWSLKHALDSKAIELDLLGNRDLPKYKATREEPKT